MTASQKEIHKVRRYLIDWYWVEEGIHLLEGDSLKIARILFQALKHLNEHELRMLQLKYHELALVNIAVHDHIIAYYLSRTTNSYRKERISLEKKLVPIILKLEEKEGFDFIPISSGKKRTH